MNAQNNAIATAARIIGRRVFGPFRETGGTPGDRESFRLEKAARVYMGFRRFRAMPAREALERAASVALRSDWPKGQWYGPRGGAGQPWDSEGTRLRWLENTAAAGFRFCGWSDEIARETGHGRSIEHTGWYSRAGDWSGDKLRGGVWQLPARDGSARYVPGYAEFEGRGETNPGSAALALWEIERGERGDERDDSALWEAARAADGIAEAQAEAERDYSEAQDSGQQAAEQIGDAETARAAALALVSEMRALERESGRPAGIVRANALKALSDAREALETARRKRESAWADCPGRLESAWRDGYADTAGRDGWNRFARGLRLARFNGEAGSGLIDPPAAQAPAVAGELV